MVISFLKIVLIAVMVCMFSYGCIAIQSGRVYGKGRWYERSTNGINYWCTIFIYLLSPPLLIYVSLSAK